MTENILKLQHNFQPMPKRFMVWDTVKKKFFEDRQGNKVFTLHTLLDTLGSRFYLESEWRICQSTSLFDQNGKEIFEGSVLYLYTEYDNGLYTETETAIMYVVNDRGEWVCHDGDGNVVDKLCDVLDDNEIVDICGHILESPDLNALKIKLDNAEVDARKEESEALGRFVESIEPELVEEK